MHGQCAIRKIICDPATVTYVLLRYAKRRANTNSDILISRLISSGICLSVLRLTRVDLCITWRWAVAVAGETLGEMASAIED